MSDSSRQQAVAGGAGRTRGAALLTVMGVLGGAALLYQTLLIREAMVLLYGNELSWGLALSAWLLGVAAGAAGGGIVGRTTRRALIGLVVLTVALAVLFPLDLAVMRVGRSWLEVATGTWMPLEKMVWLSLATITPCGFVIGWSFPPASVLGGAISASRGAGPAQAAARWIGRVYLVEAAGSLLAGVLFVFLLVGRFDHFSIAAGAGVALLGSTAWLVAVNRRGVAGTSVAAALGCLAIAGVVGIAAGWPRRLDERTARARWQTIAPGIELLSWRDSPFQHIAVGRREDQYTLYLNGRPAASFPDMYTTAPQAQLWMCQHPDPKDVLLIGGAAGDYIPHLLSHPLRSLHVVELDPAVLALAERYWSAQTRAALKDPRVQVHLMDGRRLIQTTTTRFDVVILRVPDPSSALLGRYYTRQFFRRLAERLKPKGLVVFDLASSPGDFSPEVTAYLKSVYLSLAEVFEHVMVTWGPRAEFYASADPGVFTRRPQVLIDRFERRGVQSEYFPDPSWFEGLQRDQLAVEHLRKIQDRLDRAADVLANTDERPITSIYYLILWQQMQGRRAYRGLLGVIHAVTLWKLIAALVGLWIVVVTGALVFRRGGGLKPAALIWSISTTGMISMGLEINLLFAFQTLYGYVYEWIGLLVAVFMVGLVIGSGVCNRLLIGRAEKGVRLLIAIEGAMVVLIAALPQAVSTLQALQHGPASWTLVEAAIVGLLVLAGILGGLVFPLTARLYLAGRPSTARAAAAVDAGDHFGACIGAILTGVFLVPVLGLGGSCVFLGAAKLLSIAGLALAAVRRLRP